jgi:RNA polymerase sigma-70 factor, ECF subfamily
MADAPTLEAQFEAHREHLRAVAYRMLGSSGEADDAVQEAWLRLSGAEAAGVENLRSWLTTVVARICLDLLRARKSRREKPLENDATGIATDGPAPDAELLLADSVGLAMFVVLETLAPAERIAFVLHDMFDVPFDDIAGIVGRSPMAARQLASRARRRVQGASASGDADRARQRQIVDAFLAAARGGDFEALLAVLDPDVVLRADPAAVGAAAAHAGAPLLAPEVRGARAVADSFKGRARGARPALVGGAAGAAYAPGGIPQAAFAFTFSGDRIVAIEIVMDAARLRALAVAVLDL